MRRLKWKQLFAGTLIACLIGGVGLRFVWATPGAGVTPTPLAGPVALDEIDIVAQNETHGLLLKTRGEWETRVVHYRVVPGGHFGWHSHPGPAFAMVTAGKLTYYHADDPTTPIVYPAGAGFVDFGDVHIAGNAEAEGDTQVVVFFLIPKGSSPRVDEPAP